MNTHMGNFSGCIKVLKEGFGFLTVEGLDDDVFFHANNLEGVEFDSLNEGETLEFEIGEGKNGKNQAINVSVIREILKEIICNPESLIEGDRREALLEKASRLPFSLQLTIIFILMNIVLPLMNSISANLITPFVEQLIESNFDSGSCNLEKIEPLPVESNNYSTNTFNFITGNKVRLREAPSIKSTILNELPLGQSVRVLSREKNWVEVTYIDQNNDRKHGWVSATYLAKFIFKNH